MNEKELIKEFERLQPIPDTTNFSNGGGYIQQDLKLVQYLTDKIEKTFNYNFGILGRYLNDNDSKLYKYWIRLSSIDTTGKEWGQPYYATHLPQLNTCLNLKFKKKIERRNKLNEIEKNI